MEKNSYLNRERKNNAKFMRESGHGDVLAMRKSIGRKAKSEALKKRVGYLGSFHPHEISAAKKSYRTSMKEPFDEKKHSQHDSWENYLPGMANHKKK